MYATYCRLNVHVLDSNLTVLRALRKMFSKGARARQYRHRRHTMYRQILSIHRQQRELYVDVMSGKIGVD